MQAKEWSSNSKYNSFNSYKGLTYYREYQEIISWFKGSTALPAPIEASLDPINACNQQCYYCNSQRYLRDHPAKLQKWDKIYIKDLLIELANEGIKAFCWGGGGEALLNDSLRGMTEFGTNLGMEASIITNGVLLNHFKDLLLCRWIGISLDSANPDVYRKVRGTDSCKKVLKNIKSFMKKRIKTDVCIKALVLPETIDSLVYTCKIARDLGVQDFHIRPVDFERKDYRNGHKVNFDMEKVKDVFDECQDLETDCFRVYTVTHKYNDKFHVKHEFNKCQASLLVKQVCTDQKLYVCVDHRLEPRFEISKWGSSEHRELLKSINPKIECSRCTWSEYNKQIEDVVCEDKMCRNFP